MKCLMSRLQHNEELSLREAYLTSNVTLWISVEDDQTNDLNPFQENYDYK